MGRVFLEAERLVLRQFTTMADLDDLVALDAEPAVTAPRRMSPSSAIDSVPRLGGQGLRDRGIPGSRGQGLGEFGEFGVRGVVASSMAVNVGPWRVTEKAGLRYVRTLHLPWPDRIEGEEHGDVECAPNRDEWERG